MREPLVPPPELATEPARGREVTPGRRGWFGRRRTALRALGRILTALGVLVLLAAAAAAGVLWLTLPPAHQTVRIDGLSAPANLTFDRDGIPRIRAASELDAATALGFVHARDRMFQMDIMRRTASGRLSEIAGPRTLGIDKLMRTLGLRQAALAEYAEAPESVRNLLEAYSRGVNAWIAARGRFSALEFLPSGPPEAWQPVDCLLWGQFMALWLSSNYRTELARQALVGKLSTEQIYQLWPMPPEPGRPDAAAGDPRFAAVARALDKLLPRFPDPFTQPSTASNEWAVDGRHSASGAPLLAGDPHLAFGFPGLWYLVRIETPNAVLSGATSPGEPFLVLGHNGHIAWTFATTGADTQDIFIETPVDAGHYKGPDGPLPYGLREERIRVRGQPDVMLTVRATRHGPLISDLLPKGGPLLAVEMANLAPHDTAAQGLYDLNRATNVAEAGRAAALISTPVQNLLVADRERIALFVTGRVPIRRSGDGSMPVEGADGEHDWIGFASGDQLPRYVAPASGRLVNANERVAPPDYGVFLGRDWFGDWRARRIRQMVGTERHALADFTAMQADVISTYAEQLLPTLRAVPAPPGIAGEALALLRNWDGAMARDLPQPLIFNAWLRRFHADVMARAGVPPATAASPAHEFVAWVLTPAGAGWCGGDCQPMLAAALKQATAKLAQRYGNDPKLWRWGSAHRAVFAEQALQGVPVLGRLASRRIAAPGDGTTVDRAAMPPDSFDAVHGPSFRGAYDLADLDGSRFVAAPGQSGNPFSAHAWDFLERWRDGATISLGPVPAHISATANLVPQP